MTITVTVADRPEVSAPKLTVLREIELTDLTPAIRAERGIRSGHGALVTNVSDRVRDEIGIEEGDVIVQINRTPVTSAADVKRAFDFNAGRQGIRIVFERGGVATPHPTSSSGDAHAPRTPRRSPSGMRRGRCSSCGRLTAVRAVAAALAGARRR